MLPTERASQYQIEIELRISGKHPPVSPDETRKIFSRLNCSVMEKIRLANSQARQQILKQYWFRWDSIEKCTVIAFIDNMNF